MNRSATQSETTRIVNAIIEDGELFRDLLSELRASRVYTHMGVSAALQTKVLGSLREEIMRKRPDALRLKQHEQESYSWAPDVFLNGFRSWFGVQTHTINQITEVKPTLQVLEQARNIIHERTQSATIQTEFKRRSLPVTSNIFAPSPSNVKSHTPSNLLKGYIVTPLSSAFSQLTFIADEECKLDNKHNTWIRLKNPIAARKVGFDKDQILCRREKAPVVIDRVYRLDQKNKVKEDTPADETNEIKTNRKCLWSEEALELMDKGMDCDTDGEDDTCMNLPEDFMQSNLEDNCDVVDLFEVKSGERNAGAIDDSRIMQGIVELYDNKEQSKSEILRILQDSCSHVRVDPRSKQAFVYHGGIGALFSVIEDHKNHVEILEKACRLVGQLVSNNDANIQSQMCTHFAVTQILASMTTHMKRNVSLHREACGALLHLLKYSKNLAQFTLARGSMIVMKSMRAYARSTRVQKYGIEIFNIIAARDLSSIDHQKIVDTIISAIKGSKNKEIQLKGRAVLVSLVRNGSHQSKEQITASSVWTREAQE